MSAKFLTFSVGGEEYAVDILKVQEIIGMLPITYVPGSHPSIEGVVNLRGRIIAVIHLAHCFGMAASPRGDESCIVVTQTARGEMGILVERVSDVVELAPEDVEGPRTLGLESSSKYLLGIGKTERGICMIVDIERVVASTQALNDPPQTTPQSEEVRT